MHALQRSSVAAIGLLLPGCLSSGVLVGSETDEECCGTRIVADGGPCTLEESLGWYTWTGESVDGAVPVVMVCYLLTRDDASTERVCEEPRYTNWSGFIRVYCHDPSEDLMRSDLRVSIRWIR